MADALISFFLILLPIILSIFLQRKKTNNLPPGPAGLPLIGIFHQLTNETPFHEYFRQLSQKYGPLIYMKFGSRPVLVANSPKMAEQILKTHDLTFCSRPPLLCLRKVSYEGSDIAFAPYSDNWREMRKTCVLHLLSSARVRSFRPIREDEVSRLVERISEEASRQETINLTEKIVFLTSMTICRVAFGKRYEMGSGESEEFNHIIREFQVAVSAFYFTDYFPWLGWVDRVMGKIGELDRVFKKWDLFYQQLIDEHCCEDRPKSMEGDVLDIMLQLRQENQASFRLPLDHIKAVLMNVYFASTDTIATTTIWVMAALIKNPTALTKAQAELRALTPSIGDKRMLEEEDISAAPLPYFHAVIKEAMRLYSTAPLLVPRETMQTCTIDGYQIQAKTLVYVNAWAISRDPKVWENSDAFIPERFLVEGENVVMDFKGQDSGFIPFGAGRWACPGATMALATVEIVVANLLYLFDWELPHGVSKEDVDNDILPGLTLYKKNPLYLVAKRFI